MADGTPTSCSCERRQRKTNTRRQTTRRRHTNDTWATHGRRTLTHAHTFFCRAHGHPPRCGKVSARDELDAERHSATATTKAPGPGHIARAQSREREWAEQSTHTHTHARAVTTRASRLGAMRSEALRACLRAGCLCLQMARYCRGLAASPKPLNMECAEGSPDAQRKQLKHDFPRLKMLDSKPFRTF